MIGDATSELAKAFSEALPVVLVAGQGFTTLGSASDLILSSLFERLSVDDQSNGWRSLLRHQLSNENMVWLSERFDRSVPSDLALSAIDLPWSAVFTSSIEPRFARHFETRGRQPEAVLARDFYARASRSRSRPPVHYLLGKADETSSDYKVPKNNADLTRRLSTHASELLNRIPETTTVSGVVVVAGFEPGKDWLPLDALLAPLSDRNGTKVLWFGDVPTGSDIATEMIAGGSLLVASDTFAQAITYLAHNADLSSSVAPDDPGVVSIQEGALYLTPALKLRVESSATIIDDSWTDDLAPLSVKVGEDRFRRFHGGLGGFRTQIEGVQQGFSIERDFEASLWKTVQGTVRRFAQSDRVILLHGQSGTGKSISLARLASRIRRDLRLPVIYASNRLPDHLDVDAFCTEAERAGSPVTVLLCDANQAPFRYRDLSSAMQSRGRRLLIIATCYRIVETDSKAGNVVEADNSITKVELNKLRELLSRFGNPDVKFDLSNEDSSILGMLYRAISAGRERLTAGVSGEARAVESLVRDRARRVPREKPTSAIAEQLQALGLSSAVSELFEEDESRAATGEDAAGRLIDYVMVAGRLDCPVPLNLLIRVLGQGDTPLTVDQIAHLFLDLDLFRWKGNGTEGNDLSIAPRLQLEAEMICRKRLGDRSREIARLIELIRAVRLSGVDRSSERAFLIDLLQKLDRDGPRSGEYREGYLAFADALKEVREHNGVSDSALMLRESVFRRQAVWALDGPQSASVSSDHERLSILNAARETVELAIRLIDSGELRAGRRTRLNLSAERASIYGYLAVQRSRAKDYDGSWADYLAAKAASAKAIALSDDYHAIDIALWTSSDVLRDEALTTQRRVEVLADLHSALDLVDGNNLRSDQLQRFYERRARVAGVLGDKALSVEALADLESIAPGAVTFLVAKQMAQELDFSQRTFDANARLIAGRAADYIAGRGESGGGDDVRCQRLFVQLRWIASTGNRLFQVERGAIPADPNTVRELLLVVSALNERSVATARNQERFLEAVLTWVSGDLQRASELWRSLSRDTEYEDHSRIIRWLVVSDEAGKPRVYRGRVEGTKGGDGWKVRVEGISIPVPMLARDFANEDLAVGRELRGIGVAFNYVGPIADPLVRPIGRR